MRSAISTCSYGRYLWIGIPDGFCIWVALVIGVGFDICVGLLVSVLGDGRRYCCNARSRGEGVGLRLQTLAAATKKKQPETHDVRRLAQHPRERRTRISMRDCRYVTPKR
ncbi:hypothetical protein GCM10009612_15680 [Streptomyces beijiangensis]